MIHSGYPPPPELNRVRNIALGLGVVFSAMFLAGAFIDRSQFFHAYLVGFIFWTGLTAGSLALLMLQHLTGGGWGIVIRRVLEASTRTLPLILILFVPIAFGLKYIYPWTDPQVMGVSEALKTKAHYLNPAFFNARAAAYLLIWSVLAILLNNFSLQQDRTAESRFGKRMRMLSGPGLGLFIITTTFAAIDWVMSLDPSWSSTMYGLIFVASWSLTALAFTILMTSWLSQREPMSGVVKGGHFNDLGNLLLTLVMLWTYFAFSQYLIVWSGNLPEETVWYVARKHDGWGAIALGIVILQFAFPFMSLLSKATKRSSQKLAMLAVLILGMRIFDVLWLVEPSFNRDRFHLSWMDIAGPIAMGGLWIGTFAWQLQKRSLVPINDPQLEQALAAHEGH